MIFWKIIIIDSTIELLFEIQLILSEIQESKISYICLNISNTLLKENYFFVSINFGLSDLNSSLNLFTIIITLCLIKKKSKHYFMKFLSYQL